MKRTLMVIATLVGAAFALSASVAFGASTNNVQTDSTTLLIKDMTAQVALMNNTLQAMVQTAPAASNVEPQTAPVASQDRNNCEEMRGTEYRSQNERDWFLSNCIVTTTMTTSDRYDCAQIRLDPNYRSVNERAWFLANCVTHADAAVALQLQPLSGNASVPSTQSTSVAAPIQKAQPTQNNQPVQTQQTQYPAPDTCNAQYPSFAVGIQATVTGCNVIGDIQLLEGNKFVRKYDNDPTTGLFTDCVTRVCTFIPDFAGANASSRSIQDFNSREGCGPSCHFTTVQQVPFEASCKHEGFSLVPRAREKIEQGCTVSGDISVNTDPSGGGQYTQLYQDGKPATTGTLFTCATPTGCWIMAGETWGASVSADTADNIAAGMRDHGCINGCTVVNRFKF